MILKICYIYKIPLLNRLMNSLIILNFFIKEYNFVYNKQFLIADSYIKYMNLKSNQEE